MRTQINDVDLTDPFAIDSHLGGRVDTKIIDLLYVNNIFHIRRVASSPEDACNFGVRIDIAGGNEGARGVIDEGFQRDG